MPLNGHTVLYGGSFNPPHMGHQMACLYLLEALGADALWLLPAWNHPFGKALEPFEHRVAMCTLLGAPFGERAAVMTVERDLSGRTFDTLVHLHEHHPERTFALVVGADILAETHAWYRWDAIESMVRVVVMGRRGYPSPPVTDDFVTVHMPEVSSTEIRARLGDGQPTGGLLPASVAGYIADHGLYRGA